MKTSHNLKNKLIVDYPEHPGNQKVYFESMGHHKGNNKK